MGQNGNKEVKGGEEDNITERGWVSVYNFGWSRKYSVESKKEDLYICREWNNESILNKIKCDVLLEVLVWKKEDDLMTYGTADL